MRLQSHLLCVLLGGNLLLLGAFPLLAAYVSAQTSHARVGCLVLQLLEVSEIISLRGTRAFTLSRCRASAPLLCSSLRLRKFGRHGAGDSLILKCQVFAKRGGIIFGLEPICSKLLRLDHLLLQLHLHVLHLLHLELQFTLIRG